MFLQQQDTKIMISHHNSQQLETDQIDNHFNTSQMLADRPPYYGYLKPLCRDAEGNPKYMLGPHYPVFLTAFSFCFMMIALFFIYQIHLYSTFWKIIISISSGSFLLSYLHIGFSNPGIANYIRPLSKIDKASNRYCNVCEIIRGRKTQHCDDCGVCILQLDHHCPWVGKCIGAQNVCAFYVFIGLTFGNLIIYFIATTVTNMMKQAPNASIPA